MPLTLEDFKKSEHDIHEGIVHRTDYDNVNYSISVYHDTEWNKRRKQANTVQVMFYIVHNGKYVFEVVTLRCLASALRIINGLELTK